MTTDSTQRFSDRVASYVQARPGYLEGVYNFLQGHWGWDGPQVMADVGSGTGISAELFLKHGHTVYGVEPNAAMRGAAEQCLAGYAGFHSIDGTAEATTLPAASMDVVLAAQAFHWFRPSQARQEWRRILRPPFPVVLLWNTRRLEGTPFLVGYESLLQTYGTDYRQVSHQNLGPDEFEQFFQGPFEKHMVPNAQELDLAGLQGRLLSSSYMPGPGHPQHEPLLAASARLFDETQVSGRVRLEYDTEIYVGCLSRP